MVYPLLWKCLQWEWEAWSFSFTKRKLHTNWSWLPRRAPQATSDGYAYDPLIGSCYILFILTIEHSQSSLECLCEPPNLRYFLIPAVSSTFYCHFLKFVFAYYITKSSCKIRSAGITDHNVQSHSAHETRVKSRKMLPEDDEDEDGDEGWRGPREERGLRDENRKWWGGKIKVNKFRQEDPAWERWQAGWSQSLEVPDVCILAFKVASHSALSSMTPRSLC